MRDLKNNSTVVSILPALSRAAAAYEDIVDTYGEGRKILAILDIGGVAQGGTLDVVFTESDTEGGVYTALNTVAQKIAAGTTEVDLTPTKRFVKATATVAVAAVDFAVIAVVYNERYIPSNVSLI